MIKLDVRQNSNICAQSIEVEVLGITEKKIFVLMPEYQPSHVGETFVYNYSNIMCHHN